MAKASEQFRQSDVAVWGIVALVCGGMAVFGANVSALVPQGILAGLHKTRIDGASIDQLRVDVVDLNEEAARLRRENTMLVTRFALQEQAGNEVIQRVGALEVSLPKLIEALPQTAEIDRSSLTGSIGEGETLTYDADGGSVAIRREPMELPALPAAQPIPEAVAALPEIVIPDEAKFGIAVGPSVSFEDAAGTWNDLSLKLGPLLLGLSPLLADEAESDEKRIVAGPISELSEASALCTKLERVSIACMPMPFGGTPLSF
ncbi:hypothetical protein [uncultured Devosia sp.]|uniref:hypothetical protein n=1 Tax=uncultured Devosia sp. TaxID=211434 RepID=UPI0035CC201E